MNAWDSLEAELRAATRRAAHPRTARRRRRAPLLALATAAALALVVVALAIRGTPPDETVPADERPVTTSPTPVSTPSGSPEPAISPADSPVPAEQLAAFAVLRRAQTTDEQQDVVVMLRRMRGQTLRGIRAGAIRVLSRAGGELVALIPVERAFISADRTKATRDALCLLRGSEQRGFGMSCGSFADALRGRVGTTLPPAGLAPDVAHRVRVRVRGARTLEAVPRNNFFDFTRPGKDPWAGIQPPQWIDKNGRRVRPTP